MRDSLRSWGIHHRAAQGHPPPRCTGASTTALHRGIHQGKSGPGFDLFLIDLFLIYLI